MKMRWYNLMWIVIALLVLVWIVGLIAWHYFVIEILNVSGQVPSIFSGILYGVGMTYLLSEVYKKLKENLSIG